MKITRRQLLFGTVAVGTGSAFFFGARRIFKLYSTPNLEKLSTYKLAIDALAVAVIPSTKDSPGASDVNIADFIIHAITNCTDKKTQNNFLTGLDNILEHAIDKYGISVTDCTVDQRIEMLLSLEAASSYSQSWIGKVERKLFGDNFIYTLKRLVVWGYCTSELGATIGLSYDYIPAKFVGDVILKPGQKSWATS